MIDVLTITLTLDWTFFVNLDVKTRVWQSHCEVASESCVIHKVHECKTF